MACGRGCRNGPDPLLVEFDAYGPGDSAVLIECVTEDPERAASALRRVLARHGGALGARGAVSYLFREVGVLRFEPIEDPGPLLAAAERAGAEDVRVAHGRGEVLTDPRELPAIRQRLQRDGFVAAYCGRSRRASSALRLSPADTGQLERLLRALSELSEVRSVYTNAEIPDQVLASL